MSDRLLSPAATSAATTPLAVVLHSVEDDLSAVPSPANTPDQAPLPGESAPAAAPDEGIHEQDFPATARSGP